MYFYYTYKELSPQIVYFNELILLYKGETKQHCWGFLMLSAPKSAQQISFSKYFHYLLLILLHGCRHAYLFFLGLSILS